MSSKKPFYGWAITSMGMLGNALQGAFVFWTMGMYTSAFEDEFGAPRAKITLIETLITVGVNVISPVVGWWVDKRSARQVVAVGTFALGTAFLIMSMAGTLIHVWVVFATLIPLGVLAVGVVPSSALISRWFRKRRGFMLGLSVTGSSIGGMIGPPVVTFLFMSYGWRTAMQIVGVFIILMAPVFYKVLADSPEDKGLEQEEEAEDTGGAISAADSVNWEIKELLKTRALYLQTIVSGGLLAITLGMLANLSLHAKDLGIEGQQTAFLYSLIAMCSLIGKVAFGTLTDRFGIKRTGAISITLMISGMLVFLMTKSYVGLIAGAFFVGFATGGVTPLWTTMIARGFGARSFGRAIGIMNPLHIPITAPSAPLAGYISDTTGSYDLVFIMYMGYAAVAAIALFLLQTPRHPSLQAAPAA